MPGLVVFRSLQEALDAGFQVYHRLVPSGYLVRRRTKDYWEMALVDLRKPQALADPDECC